PRGCRRAAGLIAAVLRPEQHLRLSELRPEAPDRQLLLLVDRRVDRPACSVAVAPLAPDRDGVARHPALGEPATEVLLGTAVAARGVHVADSGGTRGVEHLGAARVERFGRALEVEVTPPAQRDVSGPADGGQPEAEPRDDEPGASERAVLQHDPDPRRSLGSALTWASRRLQRVASAALSQVQEPDAVEEELPGPLQEPEGDRVRLAHAEKRAQPDPAQLLRPDARGHQDGPGTDALRQALDDEAVEPAD